jgi:hypothetical protein
MPLTCSCDVDYEYEEGDWYYDFITNLEDFEPLQTKRRRRCVSCGELINIGAPSIKYSRVRYPYDDLESRKKLSMNIEDALEEEAKITASPHYHCEKCGEIWLNLQAVGFECIAPNENMPKMLEEYQHDYAPPKLENNQ